MQHFLLESRSSDAEEWKPAAVSDYIERKAPADIKERRLDGELEEIVIDTPVESEAIRTVDICQTQDPNTHFRLRKVVEGSKARKLKQEIEMPKEVDYDEPRPSDIKWVMAILEFMEDYQGDNIISDDQAEQLGLEHISDKEIAKLLANSLKNSNNFIDYLESKIGEDKITPEEEFETQMMAADRFSEIEMPHS